MKKMKFGLLVWILAAIVLGVICGQFFPPELARVFVTFNGLFGQFLGFAIPLIIVGLVTPAIGELGRGAGKWLAITTFIAYVSTLLSGSFTYVVAAFSYPHILSKGGLNALANPEEHALKPYFEIQLPAVFPVMTALLLAFVLGIGLSLVQGNVIRDFSREFRQIIIAVIENVIIPLLPLHVFGIFLNLTVSGQAWTVISAFLAVVILAFILNFTIILFQYLIAGAYARINPFKAIWNMLPAYATALGTSSSAATIPVTLKCAKKNKVSNTVADFTIPLCATIHLSGSTMKIVAFSMAIMYIGGVDYSFTTYIGFIFMLGVTMVAAPGVPGGAIAAAAGLLASMLGFNEVQVGLMFATYIAIDSFGTACNVTGDGAIALIINKMSHGRIGENQDLVTIDPPVENEKV